MGANGLPGDWQICSRETTSLVPLHSKESVRPLGADVRLQFRSLPKNLGVMARDTEDVARLHTHMYMYYYHVLLLDGRDILALSPSLEIDLHPQTKLCILR